MEVRPQEPVQGQKNTPGIDANTLALRRTALAADRTLLAWVRTSLSLIGFGFTVYKFFQYLDSSGMTQDTWQPVGPRRFGLVMIGIATILLAMQTWQYYKDLQALSTAQGRKAPKTPSFIAGISVTLLGLAAFFTIFLRVPLF